MKSLLENLSELREEVDESVEMLDQEPDFRVYPIGPASGRVLPVLDARGKGEAVHKEVLFIRTTLSQIEFGEVERGVLIYYHQ